ncbi:MAG: type I glutamate--ammonia ligase [candidate division Zixibacteria bacterium]|nr:type I glutamate--ammonia ligase [candidate division Zixibacteria bacterium]
MAGLDKFLKTVKEKRIQYIDLKFCDLLGDWHHITMPVANLNQDLFNTGVGVDGSSLPGFTSIERGDMIVIPDPNTSFIDPFFEQPTLSFICDIMAVEKGIGPYSRNPRRLAGDAGRYVKEVRPGTEVMLGPEFEFYLFDDVRFNQGPGEGYYFIDSEEAEWNTAGREGIKNLGYKVQYKGGYHAAPPKDRTYNLRSEITSLLGEVGVQIKYHHHEVGGAGQHEIETQFDTILRMADQSMLVKYFVKNHSFRRGKSATFMPKPLFNEPGSGLHVHQYLADKNGSIYYDKKGPARLSKEGLYYVGGLLKHAPALFAFTNPSTNSYKRLIPGFEAPVRGTYSVGNRTACIRIPGYLRNPKMHRMEFRPPDSTCNPYLAYAAMVMAGLDGIKNKIDPGEPFDKDLTHLSEKELARIPMLPTSLTKALDALERDYQFLLKGGVFTRDLIESWIVLKRKDVEQIRIRPHPWEFYLYYDR